MTKKHLLLFILAGWFSIDVSVEDMAFAQDLNPQEIWNRVVEANRAWLTPYPGDIYYEIQAEDSQVFDGPVKIWCKGMDRFKLEFSIPGSELQQWILNQGLLYLNIKDHPFFLFNAEPPLHLKNAILKFAPLAFELANSKNWVILSAKNERWKDRDVIRLEIRNPNRAFNRYGRFIPLLYFPNQINDGNSAILVDPQNWMILAEEFNNSSLYGVTKKIGEFSGGFLRTNQGFVPRAYTVKEEILPSEPWRIQYAWLNNRLCIPQEVLTQQMLSGKASSGNYRVQNISFEPIDPGIFNFKTDAVDIQDPTGGDGIIRGRVLDVDTKQPVSGVKVKLLKSENETRTPLKGETTTGNDGSFEFSHQVKSLLFVSAEKENYLPAVMDSERTDFSLIGLPKSIDQKKQSVKLANFTADSPVFSVDLFLGKARSVKGKVVRDDTGEPVVNASVVVSRDKEQVAATQTKEDGSFLLTNLPPQSLYIGAYAEGYAKDDEQVQMSQWGYFSPRVGMGLPSSPGSAARNYYGKVELNSRQIVDDIVLRLTRGNMIEGIVQDVHGNPIENAIVLLTGSSAKPVKTAGDGKYLFDCLDLASSSIYGNGLVAMATGFIRSSTTLINIQGNRLHQDIVLHKGGRLEGIVLGADDKPLGGVKITPSISVPAQDGMSDGVLTIDSVIDTAFPEMANPGLRKPLVSGTDGRFQSAPLVLAAYTIEACTDGYQPLEQKMIAVTDEATSALTIKMKRAEKIGGIVVGPTGEPMAGISIYLDKYDPNYKENPDDLRMTGERGNILFEEMDFMRTPALPVIKQIEPLATKEDGRFEFDQLEEGTYRIIARFENAQTQEAGWMPLVLHGENILPGKTDLRLQFLELYQKKPTIHGKVIDKKSGEAISDFKINSDLEIRGGETLGAKHGVQNPPVATGEFWLKKIPFKQFNFSISANGYTAKNFFLSNLKPNENYDVFTALKKEGKITGRLISNAVITIDDYRLKIKAQDYASGQFEEISGLQDLESTYFKIDTDGRFQIPNLSSGMYVLHIIPKGGVLPIKTIPGIQVHFGETLDLGDIRIKPEQDLKEIMVKVQCGEGEESLNNCYVWVSDSLVANLLQNNAMKLPASVAGTIVGIIRNQGIYYRIPEATESFIFKYAFPKGGGTLTGVVTEKGKIVKKGEFRLITDPGKEPVRTYRISLNEMGRFSLPNLAAGKAWLYGNINSVEFPDSRLFRAMELNINPNTTAVQMVFGNGKNISGIVKNQDGEPVPGASVFYQYHLPKNDVLEIFYQYFVNQSFQADQYGQYMLHDLQPGIYTVWASLYGEGVSEKKEIVIDKEDINKLEFLIKM